MPKYSTYQLRMSPEHIERMQEIAEARDVPVSQVYRTAIQAWLGARYPYGPTDERPHVVTGAAPLRSRPLSVEHPKELRQRTIPLDRPMTDQEREERERPWIKDHSPNLELMENLEKAVDKAKRERAKVRPVKSEAFPIPKKGGKK